MSIIGRDNRQDDKWILIIYTDKQCNMDKQHNMDEQQQYDQFLLYTTKSLKLGMDISQIYYDKSRTILELISEFVLGKKKNVIFLSRSVGFINLNLTHRNIFLPLITGVDRHIYASIREYSNNNEYQSISKKFGINKFINSELLIIPYSITNCDYINKTINLSNMLSTQNKQFVVNISLTISALKYPNLVKNIDMLDTNNQFVNIDNPNITTILNEFEIKNDVNVFVDSELEKLASYYHNPEYIYYPYFDVNVFPKKIIDNSSKIFNTNGISIDTNKLPYQLIYKRYNTPTSGLFVKKDECNAIVPKILHRIWLDSDHAHKDKLLNPLWTHLTWTNENIKNELLANSRWEKIYYMYTTPNNQYNQLQYLVVAITILEKYGGLVIDPSIILTKSIPIELLKSKISITFQNESQNTELSYMMIASVPGKLFFHSNEKNTSQTIIDPARFPFEGKNNFFRDVKLAQHASLSNNIDDTQTIIYPELFDAVYYILSNPATNTLFLLHQLLINDPNIVIYPSYYISNNYLLQKKLSEINFGQTKIIPTRSKNIIINTTREPPQRDTKMSHTSMAVRLSENPRDRSKNNRRI